MKGVARKLAGFAHGPTIANSSGKRTNSKGRSGASSNNEQFENVIFTGIYTATVLNIGA